MVYLFVPMGIFLIDAVVKKYVERRYARRVRHSRVRNKIVIEKYYNHGAALNFMEKRPKKLLALHGGMLLLTAALHGRLLRKNAHPLAKTGTALMLGGGASNLYDRMGKGHVIDYFHVNAGPKRFRRIVFNLSDFCIFAGALLTVIGVQKEASDE